MYRYRNNASKRLCRIKRLGVLFLAKTSKIRSKRSVSKQKRQKRPGHTVNAPPSPSFFWVNAPGPRWQVIFVWEMGPAGLPSWTPLHQDGASLPKSSSIGARCLVGAAGLRHDQQLLRPCCCCMRVRGVRACVRACVLSPRV